MSIRGPNQEALISNDSLAGKYFDVLSALAKTLPTLVSAENRDNATDVTISNKPEVNLNNVLSKVGQTQNTIVQVFNGFRDDLSFALTTRYSYPRTPENDRMINQLVIDFLKNFGQTAQTIFQQRLGNLTAQLESQKDTIAQLRSEVSSLTSQLESSERFREESTQQRQLLEADLADKIRKLKECETAQGSASVDFFECANSKNALERMLSEKNKQVELLTQQLSLEKERTQKALEKIEEATGVTSKLTSDIKKVTQKLVKAEKIASQCKNSDSDNQALMDRVSSECEDVKAENANLKRDLEVATTQLNTLKEKLRPQQGTTSSIADEATIRLLKQQVDSLEKELAECKKICKKNSNTTKKLQEQVELHEEKQEEKQDDLKQQQETIKKLEKIVETVKKEKKVVENSLQEVVTSVRINDKLPEKFLPPALPTEEEKETPPNWKLTKVDSEKCTEKKNCKAKFVDLDPEVKSKQIPTEIVFTVRNESPKELEKLWVILNDEFGVPTTLELVALNPQTAKLSKLTLILRSSVGRTRIPPRSVDEPDDQLLVLINQVDFYPKRSKPIIIDFVRQFKGEDSTETQSIALSIKDWKAVSGTSSIPSLTEQYNVPAVEEIEESDRPDLSQDVIFKPRPQPQVYPDNDEPSPKTNFWGSGSKRDVKQNRIGDKIFEISFPAPSSWEKGGNDQNVKSISAKIFRPQKGGTVPVCRNEGLAELLGSYRLRGTEGIRPGVQISVLFHAYEQSELTSPDETVIELKPANFNNIRNSVDIHVRLCEESEVFVFDDDHPYLFEVVATGTAGGKAAYDTFTGSPGEKPLNRAERERLSRPTLPQSSSSGTTDTDAVVPDEILAFSPTVPRPPTGQKKDADDQPGMPLLSGWGTPPSQPTWSSSTPVSRPPAPVTVPGGQIGKTTPAQVPVVPTQSTGVGKLPIGKGTIPGVTDYNLVGTGIFEISFVAPKAWNTGDNNQNVKSISAKITKPGGSVAVCKDESLDDVLMPYFLERDQGIKPGTQINVVFHAFDEDYFLSQNQIEENIIELNPSEFGNIKGQVDIHVRLCKDSGVLIFDSKNPYLFEVTAKGTDGGEISYNASTNDAIGKARIRRTGPVTMEPKKAEPINPTFPRLGLNPST